MLEKILELEVKISYQDPQQHQQSTGRQHPLRQELLQQLRLQQPLQRLLLQKPLRRSLLRPLLRQLQRQQRSRQLTAHHVQALEAE